MNRSNGGTRGSVRGESALRVDYRPGLDGLRAVAILLVLVFHSDLGWLPGGFLGVSVFFTLSGFLITSLLLAEVGESGRVDLADFWVRRIRRLLPPALITIIGVSVASVWLSTSIEQSRLRGDALASVFYASNWRSILADLSYEEIFSTTSPLIHLWSLAIEEQMYVVIPLIVVVLTGLGFGRRALGASALLLAGASTTVAALFLTGDRLYYGTDARAAELLVGVAAAGLFGPRIWANASRLPRTLSWLGVGALVAIIVLARSSSTNSAWVHAGLLPAFALLSLICVIGAITPGPLSTLLSRRPLVAIGRVSYGLYLFHWPIFTWVDEVRVGFGGVGLFCVRLAATVAVTVSSYILIERPLRTRRMLASRRSFLVAIAGATACAVGIAAIFLDPVSGRPATEVRVLSTVPVTAPMAGAPRTAGPVQILVIGDSTAENVARALARVDTIGVISAGIIGCPLVPSVEVFDRPRETQSTSYCPETIYIVGRNIDSVDLVFVVGGVSNQWSYRSPSGNVVAPGSAQYIADFDALMNGLAEAVAQRAVPIVVLDNPTTRADEGVLGDEPAAHRAWRSQIERWSDTWEFVERINIDDALADPDSELGRRQRPDGVHLEEFFAAELARTRLVPELTSLSAELGIRLAAIGCLVDSGAERTFDLESCRKER
jgi:peptidoglycan/LPS O-acetylase OafA/YrhL